MNSLSQLGLLLGTQMQRPGLAADNGARDMRCAKFASDVRSKHFVQ